MMAEKKMQWQVTHPLEWPSSTPRTPEKKRQRSQFKTERSGILRRLTFPNGRDRLLEELRRLGADTVAVTTNMRVYVDGSGVPYSDASEPDDPGAAVYFDLDGERKCIAIDRYNTVADNLAAIAATIDAMRGIERWGGARIMATAFSGFKALPERAGGRAWHDVLGVDRECSLREAHRAFKRLAKERHPDTGGSEEEFRELSWAMEQAKQVCRRGV